MRLILLLASVLALGACEDRDRADAVFHGIPDGDRPLACRWSQGVGACVGKGKAYTCVDNNRQDGDTTHYWDVYECARVSNPVLPEEPKDD